MTIHKQVAQLRDLCGFTLRLRLEEEVAQVHIGEDRAWVIIRRARTEPRKNGYIVTRRGIQTILFKRDPAGVWNRDELTVWDTATGREHVTAWPGRSPEEHAQHLEWSEMCHRPGTDQRPMDNADRRRQGYDWYPG